MSPIDDGPQNPAELAGYAGRVAAEAADRAEAALQSEISRLRDESLRWLAAQSRELVGLARTAVAAEAKRDARVNLKATELDQRSEAVEQEVNSLRAEISGRLEEQRSRMAELERAVREISVKVEQVRATPRPLSIPRANPGRDASVLDFKPETSAE